MRTIMSLSLPKRVADQLTQLAKRLGMPRSLLVREAVERYVLESRFEELRERLRSDARKWGVVTDKDVFDRVS